MLFPFERFRFTIKVSTLMVLPPYKGAVFRGAFGNAFRRVVCAVPRADCSGCILRLKCLYVAIFEPLPPANYPDAAKFSTAPAPYVLNPPLTNRQAFHLGENLEFELVLIGSAIEALPYFIYTFTEMGRRGFRSMLLTLTSYSGLYRSGRSFFTTKGTMSTFDKGSTRDRVRNANRMGFRLILTSESCPLGRFPVAF